MKMPTFKTKLYRGGYTYGPWPRDFEQYLINRAGQGKDCELAYDGSLVFVLPSPDRGLSLFDTRGTLSDVWDAPAGTRYPGDLTLTAHPTIGHDNILAPGSKMLIGTFMDLVEEITGWSRSPDPAEQPRALSSLEGSETMRSEKVVVTALRSLIVSYDRKIATVVDEDDRVALTNDRQSVHNMVETLASSDPPLTILTGTYRALVIEALDGLSATDPEAAALRMTLG